MPETIYFDYNATTPLDPAVREAMLPFLSEIWGNPSSVHRLGRQARALLDDARDRASAVLGCKPSEVIFTSGGTEANNLAVFGAARLLRAKGSHLITSAIEHDAVLQSFNYLARKEGFELSVLPVDRQGLVSPEDLKHAIRDDTILVSVMAANNEIGTIQPIAELGTICHQRGVMFHTDAVQWLGKQPFDNVHQFNADLVSACAHKLHGPKGAGLLYARSPLPLTPIQFGGGHENERRAGTENLATIIGLVAVLERFILKPVFDPAKLNPLTHKLATAIQAIPGVHLLTNPEQCLPNTVAFIVEHTDSISLLAGLDLEGICASSGSACSAGSVEPSHVVKALGYEDSLANALIRLSLGRENSAAEVDHVTTILPEVIQRAQRGR